MMALILLLLLVAVVPCTPTQAKDDACRTCNCQINNVQVLEELINQQIRKVNILASGNGKTLATFQVMIMLLTSYYK